MIRTYNTWLKEGKNRFVYKHCLNPIHRLLAAGYSNYGGIDNILFSKKDVIEFIGTDAERFDFVYTDYGSAYKQFFVYAKKIA